MGIALIFFAKNNYKIKKDYLQQLEFVKNEAAFQDLYQWVLTAESGARGYSITGNKNFVKNFSKSIDSIRSSYNKILAIEKKQSLNYSPGLAATFSDLINRKIEFNNRLKLLCDNNKRTVAIQLLSTEEGLRLSDSIVLIQELKNKETRASINYKSKKFLAANNQNNNLAYLSILISALLIGIVLFFLTNEIKITKKISEAFKLHREHYKITLQSLSEGLITTNNLGDVQYMNPAAEKLTGWSLTEAKNKPLQHIYNVINEESGMPIDLIISRILNGGETVGLENNTVLRKRDNGDIVISNNGAPLLDGKGNIKGAVILFNDITEKKKIENKLIANEKQFRHLIESLPEAVYTCDTEGYIQHFNLASEKLCGQKPVIGKDKWFDFWRPLHLNGTLVPIDDCPMSITLKQGIAVAGKLTIIKTPDGFSRQVLPNPSPLFDSDGILTGAVNILIDVTDKLEREVLIKKTEEKYKKLIDQAADGIFIFDKQGNFKEANANGCSMLLYSKEKLLQLNLLEITPDQYKGKLPINMEQLHTGLPILVERQFVRSDGTEFYTELSAQLTDDGNIQVIVRDISERKKVEELILKKNSQLRQLSEHLQNIREEERTHIAREIHDELGQQLTVMIMDVAWLDNKIPASELKMKEKLLELHEMLNLTVKSVRRISTELRPSVLDDLGLVAAIDMHIRDFEKRTNIHTVYDLIGVEPFLEDNVKNSLFRIFQESLTNVARHAKATMVKVTIEISANEFILSIQDNGIGYDENLAKSKKTLGVLGMKERAIGINGNYQIKAVAEGGTVINIIVPLKN